MDRDQQTNGKKPRSRRDQSTLDRLRAVAEQPIRSSTLRSLLLSPGLPTLARKISPAGLPPPIPRSSILASAMALSPSSTTATAKAGSNPNELASWMSSLRQRAQAALLQNDDYEIETEKEMERQRRANAAMLYEEGDEEVSDGSPAQSFAQLGEILERKRHAEFARAAKKKQKVSFAHQYYFDQV